MGVIMHKLQMERQHELLIEQGWQLDTHSTILSRKNSYHKVIGKRRYVKPRKPEHQATA
jgi:hypothetical protein